MCLKDICEDVGWVVAQGRIEQVSLGNTARNSGRCKMCGIHSLLLESYSTARSNCHLGIFIEECRTRRIVSILNESMLSARRNVSGKQFRYFKALLRRNFKRKSRFSA